MPPRNSGQVDRVASAVKAGTISEALVPFVSDIKGQPYMSVDGRAAAASKSEHPISNLTWVNVDAEPQFIESPVGTLIVPAKHALALSIERDANTLAIRRYATGTEAVRERGRGADSTHWVANAETSALGRSLGSLGFGLIPGAGLTTSEVMRQVEQDEQRAQSNGNGNGNGNGQRAAKPKAEDSEASNEEAEKRKELVKRVRERIEELDEMGTEVGNKHSVRAHVKKSEECGNFESMADLFSKGTQANLIATGTYVAGLIAEAKEGAKTA